MAQCDHGGPKIGSKIFSRHESFFPGKITENLEKIRKFSEVKGGWTKYEKKTNLGIFFFW